MPLHEICDFLLNRDIELIKTKLMEQRKIVIDKQLELKKIENKINNRLQMIIDASTSKLEEIKIVQKESCNIIWLEKKLAINNYLDMEPEIRKLDKNLNEAVVFIGKVGLGITKENLKNHLFDTYDGIFLIFDKEDIYNSLAQTLPKTKCVSIRFCGSHKESKKYYELLLGYIEKNNLEITSFSREITLIDYGITSDIGKFVTEILIPIK